MTLDEGSATLVRFEDLLDDLHETRRRGYALEREENLAGTACVSAPIPDVPGHDAVSCSVPLFRVSAERIDLVAHTLGLGVRSIASAFAGSPR